MENEINAFAGGVEPGGLRNTTQIRILIEFLIANLREPVTGDFIIESLSADSLCNYFEVVQAIDELIKNENLKRNEETGALLITEKGVTSLYELIDDLPASVRERALSDITKKQMLKKAESHFSAETVKTENGYSVNIRVFHKETVMMSLSVYAADFEEAERIKENFKKDPIKKYADIISIICI